jgi:hypothetical protein
MGTIFDCDDLCRRVTPRGFYRDMATSSHDETILATELWRALVFMHGREKLLRLLKRDAARVFAPLAYGRAKIASTQIETPIVRGLDEMRDGKPQNDHILTPSHRKWRRFLRELKQDTADFIHEDEDRGAFEGDDVPCAAQAVLADMGLAIAESLVVLRAFGGTTDLDILRHVERRWETGTVRLYLDPAGRGESYNGLLG